MSEVKSNSKAKAWAPPLFPVGGRLPTDIRKVAVNYEKQIKAENRFRRAVDERR